MNYSEYIFGICDRTELDKKEEVVLAMQMLSQECIENHNLVMMLDEKLKEIMTAKDYDEFSEECGKALFQQWVEMCPNEDFKSFAKENMSLILGEKTDESE